ncbi:hypothetical protein F444_21176 [Phytophthora nicotianae P1976]|uniref:Uncharacterized protein n=1 Tax=Phytophthora nicotianae P1976 TaxID=1317066 RepID=A0A080Z204_PHYNI|nr:hypothetical protein F444_21176 [Phytophthora nicotianae P1976]
MEPPRLQVELEESAHASLDRCIAARHANTTRAYAPKQREYKSWCDRKGFHEATRYQVTASKLHLFLQVEVVDQNVRVKNRKRKDIPNFLVPEEWYDIKVLKAGKNKPLR